MAAEMKAAFARRIKQWQARATAMPREIAALDERIAKLRSMSDLTDDEREMLVGKAEGKRRELQAAQPEAKQQAKILTMLPKAAAQ